MSCPRAWLQAQPVTHLPIGPEVSHGGPGDGKETHKHGQVGRAVLEAGVSTCLGPPAMSSHTQTPVGLLGRRTPDCLESCALLASCPGFASALERLATHLTDGDTEAHGYQSSCDRGLGPRLRTQSSFPPR